MTPHGLLRAGLRKRCRESRLLATMRVKLSLRRNLSRHIKLIWVVGLLCKNISILF
jgi:hypothetical protein